MKEKDFLSFPFAPPPNFVHCMRKRVDRPRVSVKGKKGHKNKDLRQKEGHIRYIRKGQAIRSLTKLPPPPPPYIVITLLVGKQPITQLRA